MTTTTEDLAALGRVRGLTRSGTAKRIRQAAGITIAEAARAAEVSERAIYRWEGNQSVPHGPAALRYAALLDRLAALGMEG